MHVQDFKQYKRGPAIVVFCILLLLSLTKLRAFFRVRVEVLSPAIQFFVMRPTFLPWDTRVTLLSSRARGDAKAWDTFAFCKERLLKGEFLGHEGHAL